MSKRFLLVVFVLVLFFFFSRLWNLTLLPIFTDEAIYLRWAQIALNDPAWRFISLTDGKQPLLIWLMLPLLKIFTDPLLAGRLVSVLAGFFGMVGIGILGWEVSKNFKTAVIASFFYLLCPFFLMYDRLALMDSLLAIFGIWSLWLSLVLVKTLRLDVAIIFGLVLGGGLLTKSSANFYLYFLPVTLLIFDWQAKKRWTKLLNWFILVLIAFALSQLIYAILRLSPLFFMIGQKNLTFIFSFEEFLKEPFHFFLGNLKGLTSWLVGYLTIPLIILILLGIILELKRNFFLTLLLLFWFFFPFCSLAAFGRVIYPRFILFMISPLFLFASSFLVFLLEKLKSKLLFLLICFLFFIYSLYFDFQIIFDPINAPLPNADRKQYLEDWPAGFGVKETIAFLKEEAKKGKIFVGTEGTFGLFPASLELYLANNENIKIKGYWPTNTAFSELEKMAKIMPTYFISKETENFDNPKFKLLFKYRRGKGDTFLQVFKVLSLEKTDSYKNLDNFFKD